MYGKGNPKQAMNHLSPSSGYKPVEEHFNER